MHLYEILVPDSQSTNIITIRNTWLTALGNDGADCDSHKLVSIKKLKIISIKKGSEFLNVTANYIYSVKCQ